MKTMSTDSEYHVSSHDWPAGTRENDLTLEQANEVFDLFDRFYPLAVQGLAKVAIPPPSDKNE
ncbi:hypothetical protein U2F26_11840 [Micromonospora sp. 4G57]|nr:hypothetical protein [Micromonospora sp. 4G57]